MKLARLPLIFLIGGILVKGVLMLSWHYFGTPDLLNVLVAYDPGAFWLAEQVVPLVFDQRRILPTPMEDFVFQLVMVLGFGLECLAAGVSLRLLVRSIQKWRTGNGSSPAVSGG